MSFFCFCLKYYVFIFIYIVQKIKNVFFNQNYTIKKIDQFNGQSFSGLVDVKVVESPEYAIYLSDESGNLAKYDYDGNYITSTNKGSYFFDIWNNQYILTTDYINKGHVSKYNLDLTPVKLYHGFSNNQDFIPELSRVHYDKFSQILYLLDKVLNIEKIMVIFINISHTLRSFSFFYVLFNIVCPSDNGINIFKLNLKFHVY